MKMIGKPYSGKPNVRFDEGELEIEPSATTPALYSTVTNNLFSNFHLEIKREWEAKVRYHCPPLVDQELVRRIEEVALGAYRALECRDVSRVDIRVGEDGIPYFLEVNPLPGLSPTYGDLPIMARKMGWDYGRLVRAIFGHALKRYGLSEG